MKFKRNPGHWGVCTVVLLILIIVCSVAFSENGMTTIEKAIFYSLVAVFVIVQIFAIGKFVRENPDTEDEEN